MDLFSSYIDREILRIIENLHYFYSGHYASLIRIGRAIGALCVLFVVAEEAIAVLSLKRSLDITKLIRPIIIAIVLASYTAFTTSIIAPTASLNNMSRQMYEKQIMRAGERYKKRTEAAFEANKRVIKEAANLMASKEGLKEKGVLTSIVEAGKDIIEISKKFYFVFAQTISGFMNNISSRIIEFFGLIIYSIASSFILFIGEVGKSFLIVAGPIPLGLSVLPIWKDTWASWLTRLISVSLYPFVAYFILSGAMQLMIFAIEVDIRGFENPSLDSLLHSQFSNLHTVVSFVIGALAVKTTPEIVSWFLPTNASHAASGFVSGVSSSLKGVAKTAAVGASAV